MLATAEPPLLASVEALLGRLVLHRERPLSTLGSPVWQRDLTNEGGDPAIL
jgi:hypothetical protein